MKKSKEIKKDGDTRAYINAVNAFNTEIYSTAENREKAQSAKNKAQHWIKYFENCFEKSKALVISSQSVGSGKTKLGRAIFDDLTSLNKIESGIYYTELKIFEVCKFGHKNKETMIGTLYNILVAPALVIDDFMSTTVSNTLYEIYKEILNYRNSNNKFTILISMYSKKGLVNQFCEDLVTKNIIMSADEIVLPNENIDMLLSSIVNFRLQKLLYKIQSDNTHDV